MTVATFTSTGDLPEVAERQRKLQLAYERALALDGGEVSRVYPQLEVADPERFGLCVASVEGDRHVVGDATAPFSLMSASKPFVLAIVREALGRDAVRERIGVDATGEPFNSVDAILRSPDGRTNPMVNAGAIATTSLVPGDDPGARRALVETTLAAFAGRALELDEAIYESAMATNARNRELARLLAERDLLGCEADEAVERYTRHCSLLVTAEDLAVMGATLAAGGVNPCTGVRVVGERTCRDVLAVMATAGMYEHSGQWLYDVGLPGKSGIGGGIVTVSPGKGALASFSPRLDAVGNSVRGVAAARELAQSIGLDLFASQPVR